MNLKHLRYFTTLAEELHFGRAAARHHITQSPLSVGIRQLEEELGFRLFQRDSKNVALTSTGQAFLRIAQELLNHSERALQFGNALAKGRAGHLDIGFTSAMIFRGLGGIISTFEKLCPDVDFSLHETSSQEQKRLVRAGRLDVGFITVRDASDGRPQQGLGNMLVCQERFVACLPLSHKLARARSIDLSALSDERFIMFARNASPGHYDQFISMCAEAGFHPNIGLEVRQFLTAAALAGNGLGVSVVPESIGRSCMPGVAFVPLKKSPIQPSAYLIWDANRTSPGTIAFVDAVRGFLAAAPAAPTMRERD